MNKWLQFKLCHSNPCPAAICCHLCAWFHASLGCRSGTVVMQITILYRSSEYNNRDRLCSHLLFSPFPHISLEMAESKKERTKKKSRILRKQDSHSWYCRGKQHLKRLEVIFTQLYPGGYAVEPHSRFLLCPGLPTDNNLPTGNVTQQCNIIIWKLPLSLSLCNMVAWYN